MIISYFRPHKILRMKVNGTSYRTVWLKEEKGNTITVPVVKLIEQNKLPFDFCIVSCQNHEETSVAIETMVVRGAGAIGATAGLCSDFDRRRQMPW
mmetsp:Transcript_3212/g.4780  ORF Transcript_3212/g.4780 Transcript_3212/m.4780 type:complete len:96 (-) Transcript_3212:872-1159(-)